MDDSIKKYLFDAFEAIEYIDLVLKEISGFEEYLSHRFYKPAFERKISIIGEALNKANKIDPNIKITNKEKIIGMRNKIIHAYDAVDDVLVWEVVKKYLPLLKMEIEQLMDIGTES